MNAETPYLNFTYSEPRFPQMPFQFSQFFLPSLFLKTALVIQTCIFEMFRTF